MADRVPGGPLWSLTPDHERLCCSFSWMWVWPLTCILPTNMAKVPGYVWLHVCDFAHTAVVFILLETFLLLWALRKQATGLGLKAASGWWPARNWNPEWIQPTSCVSLEADPSPVKSYMRLQPWLTPWLQLCETLKRRSEELCLDYWSTEIFKLLSLW